MFIKLSHNIMYIVVELYNIVEQMQFDKHQLSLLIIKYIIYNKMNSTHRDYLELVY